MNNNKFDYYTKSELDDRFSRIKNWERVVVDQLPDPPSEETLYKIYLVPSLNPKEHNIKDEFITNTAEEGGVITYSWEQIGSTEVDLSNYYTKTESDNLLNTIRLNVSNNTSEILKRIPLTQKGQANGVATLGSDGKVPAYQLQDYILSSQKGQPNGVATLNSVGLIPEGQLQFPTRGQLNVANINNLEAGVYQVNGKVIASEILGGEQASGILVAFPYSSKVQILYVGRAAGAASGEQVEVYTRRYLATPQRWTEWSNIGNDKYTLTKNGTNIELKKNGSTVSSVVDSDTTYTTMTSTQASAGTSTTGQLISAKVLKGELNKKVNVKEGKGLSTYDFDDKYKQLLDYLDCVYPVRIYYDGSSWVSDKPIDLILAARDSGKAVIAVDEFNNGRGGIYNYYLTDDSIDGCTFIELFVLNEHHMEWRILSINHEGIIDRRHLNIPLSGGGGDLSNYYTKAESDAKYLTEHQDISGKADKADLSDVATSGDYDDLENKPTLFSGNYNDLTNKPTLFSGNYNDLTNKPTIPAAQVNADWNASSGVSKILNKPTIPDVSNYYNKTEIDATLVNKADKSTTYTKTEVDQIASDVESLITITNIKLNGLNVPISNRTAKINISKDILVGVVVGSLPTTATCSLTYSEISNAYYYNTPVVLSYLQRLFLLDSNTTGQDNPLVFRSQYGDSIEITSNDVITINQGLLSGLFIHLSTSYSDTISPNNSKFIEIPFTIPDGYKFGAFKQVAISGSSTTHENCVLQYFGTKNNGTVANIGIRNLGNVNADIDVTCEALFYNYQ